MNRLPLNRFALPLLAVLTILTAPSIALAGRTVPIEQVPEPTGLLLLGLGYAVASVATYRRKQKTPIE